MIFIICKHQIFYLQLYFLHDVKKHINNTYTLIILR
jgi:hypothetical protein